MLDQPGKIVFVESAAAMGGVQFSTLYLAEALNRSRWHPVVVCPEEGDLPRACRAKSIDTKIVRQPRLWSTSVRIGSTRRLPNPFAWGWNAMVMFRASRRLKKLLRAMGPDVVVTKGLSSHLIGGFAARQLNTPCVWHVQDFISERSFGIYQRFFGWAARRLSYAIIADGATIKDQLPSSIRNRVSVIHNGIDTEVFRPEIDGSGVRRELGIAASAFVIGSVGRLTPWKGQHYLIEAFARIEGKYPHAVLLVAGSPVFDNDAYERRLRSMAAKFRLEDRIKFAGYRHDLPGVLGAMNVLAFTSIEKDTSPLALLSAMSSGRAIAAFDIDGVRELIDEEPGLLLVSTGDVDQLALAIEKLISNPELRERFSKRARRAAEQNFSLTQFRKRFEKVIDDVLAASQAKATVAEGDGKLSPATSS